MHAGNLEQLRLLVAARSNTNCWATMRFDDFTLQQVTFEMRYKRAYRLWDSSGSMWLDMTNRFGDAEPVTVEPNNTTFKIGKDLQLSLQLEKAFLIAHHPTKNLEEFQEQAKEFSDIVLRHLELTSLERVGTRIIYGTKFDSKEEASEALQSSGMIRVPNQKMLNIEGSLGFPEVSYRWEDGKLGARIQMRAVTEKLNMEFPPEVKGREAISEESEKVLVDIDYYTMSEMKVGTFRVDNWIERLRRSVSRDFDKVVGEGWM